MSGETTDVIQDAAKSHWVYRAPKGMRPYLQLSRLDRPIGYWLLTLPGWIGLAFAGLLPIALHGLSFENALIYALPNTIKWAALILIGAIAMRGAGCTYNDIVDQDLDARVERTALRPLPAGTVTSKQAWIWLLAQCAVGLVVLLCLPRLAQIISLASIPLVAAYPFMKRITWWPQVWLGLTFNWAVLVGYAINTNTGGLDAPVLMLYVGLVFWTIGYDTIYACQDIEDDALIGVKSTARRFGKHIRSGVGVAYGISLGLIVLALLQGPLTQIEWRDSRGPQPIVTLQAVIFAVLTTLPVMVAMIWQWLALKKSEPNFLKLFKSNALAAFLFAVSLSLMQLIT